MRYTGLSLSLCVSDILRGVVKVEQVDRIVASTKFEGILDALKAYHNLYWSQHADLGTVYRLLKAIWPIVEQPRFEDDAFSNNVAYGHWIINVGGE